MNKYHRVTHTSEHTRRVWHVTSMRRSTIVERNEQILSTKTQAHTTWHNSRHSYNTTGANSFALGANGIVGVHLNMRVVANSDTLGGQRKIRPIILQCSPRTLTRLLFTNKIHRFTSAIVVTFSLKYTAVRLWMSSLLELEFYFQPACVTWR